jgi:putative thiamine transport system substrate-binding protein
VDVAGKPTTRLDFSEPVEGMEAPWGMAQLTFFADRKRVPRRRAAWPRLLDFARANPGASPTRARPISTAPPSSSRRWWNRTPTARCSTSPQHLKPWPKPQRPLWAYLDALHPTPVARRQAVPAELGGVRQMMADGELLLALTFNPNEAANEIAAKRLPDSVYSFQFAGGTIGNTHFLAIPVNARAKEGAQVVANFLLSPAAQARKADIAHWGDPTVLAIDKLPATDRARFAAQPLPGQVEQPMPTLPEPHGSWVDPLEREWLKRYQVAHSVISRVKPGAREVSSSRPVMGEPRMNSTKPGLGCVRRVYSAREISTATGSPRTVMPCGPSLSARFTTSLNLPFASCSCHVDMLIS